MIDASEEKRVDWDKEIAGGHLERRGPRRGAKMHVQGEALIQEIKVDTSGITPGQDHPRITTHAKMQHVVDTGRCQKTTGRLSFGPLTCDVPAFMDHPPFKGDLDAGETTPRA